MIGVERAAVVGLGLIGGSVARELASRGIHVAGYDASESELAAALDAGVVSTALESSLAGVSDADLIVIAVPVDAAIDVLGTIGRLTLRARLITDVGSTKARIVAGATELGLARRFVGSHPMAGDHRSGWNASRLGLFAGAPVYLCPPTGAEADAIELAAGLWTTLGARALVQDAADHDRDMAWKSHLPQMVSNALALALAHNGIQRADLGPGGRDVTRLAGSSPDMWVPIATENAANLDGALAAAEREISALRAAICSRDSFTLRAQLTEARKWFEG